MIVFFKKKLNLVGTRGTNVVVLKLGNEFLQKIYIYCAETENCIHHCGS